MRLSRLPFRRLRDGRLGVSWGGGRPLSARPCGHAEFAWELEGAERETRAGIFGEWAWAWTLGAR